MGRHSRARPRKITSRLLNRWRACFNGLERFNVAFPDGCKVTFQNVLKCIQADLDIFWFAEIITSMRQYNIYVHAQQGLNTNHAERRTKLLRRTCHWEKTAGNNTKASNLLLDERHRHNRAQARLFMRVWKGTLFKKKGDKDGKA